MPELQKNNLPIMLVAPLFLVFWSSLFLSQSLMDFIATLIFLTGLWAANKDGLLSRKKVLVLVKNKLFLFLAVWFAIVSIGLLFTQPAHEKSGIYLAEFRWMLEFLVWIYLLRKLRPEQVFLPAIIALPLMNAVYGLFVFFTGFAPLPTDYLNRVGGFFGNPMPFAHTMGPVLLALVGSGLIYWTSFKKANWFYWIATAIIGLSVLLSMTRGVWIGVSAALILAPFLLRLPYRKTLTFCVLAMALFCIAAIPAIRTRTMQAFDSQHSYDSERLMLWQGNFAVFKSAPLFGVGYSNNKEAVSKFFEVNGYPDNQFVSHAHNQYLHFLSGTGVLGLLAFLVFIFYFMKITLWTYRNATDLKIRSLAAGLLLAQITFHVGAFTESNFSIARNRALALLLMATAGALYWNIRNNSCRTEVSMWSFDRSQPQHFDGQKGGLKK